jgi:hypothetical protein
VKVYGRKAAQAADDHTGAFYKDGYTDLRGRFDYASLSTDDLAQTARFAILVIHSEHGAVVKEAPPPKT